MYPWTEEGTGMIKIRDRWSHRFHRVSYGHLGIGIHYLLHSDHEKINEIWGNDFR